MKALRAAELRYKIVIGALWPRAAHYESVVAAGVRSDILLRGVQYHRAVIREAFQMRNEALRRVVRERRQARQF